MFWWQLLIEVFVVWILWALAALVGHELFAARRGIPRGQRGGMSIAPIIPLFPLLFWGGALLADTLVSPWGTVFVGWIHVSLAIVFISSITWGLWCLKSLNGPAEPGAAADRGNGAGLPGR
jgi:hypothetical protein